MRLKFTSLYENVLIALEAGEVPMITSPPGVGKSALARLVAKAFNLLYVDIRLTNYNVTTLNGFPAVNLAENYSAFIPVTDFPIEGRDSLPIDENGNQMNGWLINFDELTSCTPPMQAAAYRILLDKEVGNHKIHPDAHMMACGNGLKDGAVVNRMSTALQSRMVHYQLVSDITAFTENAAKKGFHYTVIDFVNFKPELLNNFDPKHEDFTYACERSWEKLSNIMQAIPDLADLPKYVASIEGTVGVAAAQEFIGFIRVYSKVPEWNDIVDFPEHTEVPQEPSIRAAMTHMFVNGTTRANIQAVGKYLLRMPPENQLMVGRRICMNDKSLAKTQPMLEIQRTTAMKFDF